MEGLAKGMQQPTSVGEVSSRLETIEGLVDQIGNNTSALVVPVPTMKDPGDKPAESSLMVRLGNIAGQLEEIKERTSALVF